MMQTFLILKCLGQQSKKPISTAYENMHSWTFGLLDAFFLLKKEVNIKKNKSTQSDDKIYKKQLKMLFIQLRT